MQARQLAEEFSIRSEEHDLSSTQRLNIAKRQWELQEAKLEAELSALAGKLADAKQRASDQLEAAEKYVCWYSFWAMPYALFCILGMTSFLTPQTGRTRMLASSGCRFAGSFATDIATAQLASFLGQTRA